MMPGLTLLLTALLVGAVMVIDARPVETRFDAMKYLNFFGYFKRPSPDGTGMSDDEERQGILDFQYMANLTGSGILDDATMAKMNMPRCGMADNIGHALDARRKKRYTLGSKWRKNALTYRIQNRTPDIPNPADVDAAIAAAFKVWSDVTPLSFTRVYGGARADILISFAPTAGDHGDGISFDGRSGVLAHAFFPQNGDAHFDEGERWTLNSYSGTNLVQVAAHEFGHSLGLGHSEVEGALMQAFYPGYQPNFRLHQNDIAGIRAHYGVGSGGPDVTMAPAPPNPDIPCTGRVDAFTSSADGSTYLFAGRYVWKTELSSTSVAAGFPKLIASTFAGLPNNIDTAMYFPGNRKTYFFKGSQYWRSTNEAIDPNYPRPLSDWGSLPSNLDAAFVWSGNGRIYFVQGNLYYRYRGGVDPGYPRPLSAWNIPGDRVVAAAQLPNRVTYFVTPSGDFYRFNDTNFRPEPGYPRRIELMKGCARTLEEAPPTDSAPGNGVSGLVPSLLAVLINVVLGTVWGLDRIALG